MNPYRRWRTSVFVATLLLAVVLIAAVGLLLAHSEAHQAASVGSPVLPGVAR